MAGSLSDRWAVAFADFVVRWRWLVILATVLAVVGAAAGGRHLEFANNYRVFFGADNPELINFEEFQAIYTKNDNILIVIQPKTGALFTAEQAKAVERMTADAWKTPFAIRVDSLTNFQHSWASGDDLTVEDLIRDGASMPQSELDRRKAIALAEPLLRGNLISRDAKTTGINIVLQYPEKSLTEVPEAVVHVRAIQAAVEKDFPDLTIALSGVSMLNNAFAESGQTDAMTLIPIMYGVLILFMIALLRSVSGTIGTLLVIGFSTAAAMGFAGYIGVKLTPISITAPTIVLTLAIADSIHILVTQLGLMRDGMAKIESIKESIRINALAVTITSITTIVGFLALNFSDAPPFHDLGNITAVGIAVAWAISLAFLPAVMSLLPIKAKVRQDAGGWSVRVMDRLANFVIGRFKSVLLGFGVIAVSLIALIPTLQLDDQWVKYFDHRVPFRGDAEFAIEHLAGLYPIEFSVESGEPGGVSNPEYLANLEKFTAWLREQPEVRHVYSYTDIIKRLNKNMHGDDDSWYAIPKERGLAAQYLLLYEMSLPFGLDLNDRINIDKSATRVTVTSDEVTTVQLRDFLNRSKDWLKANTPPAMHANPTSASVMFAYISERNINSMLRGNVIAVVLISLIMMFALRSVAMGAMSILPNAVPVLMTFGLWALLVGQVGMASATVTATALGIVVGDSVHLLTKYLRARREKLLSAEDAIRYAFRMVGPAIMTTTMILTVGFSVLAASTFKVNAEMGLLTAMAIVLALVFDFLFLPALLLLGRRDTEKKNAPLATAAE
ncbi:MAG: RND transporter [Rhodospirillaceae bacterium]|nr:RND transporter [Rhodospirillaceae bacterium]